ncbi:MAG: DUF6442 family protein [Eubacteriales bacterium]|nr:DUF6442 family protein [Eubacteriales bacterium]
MNKEEILRKSRQENKGQDERERRVYIQAGSWAAGVGGIVCALFILLDNIFAGSASYSTWAIYDAIFGTMWLVLAIQMKKKAGIVLGAVLLIGAVLFFAGYLKQLIG